MATHVYSLYSPFWWLQSILVLRGIALGLTVQPLTVYGLSEVKPRQLAQASSMNTVMRAVSSSLGIAVLATLVQSQSKLHYAHLVEQVTASSPLGRLFTRLEALFVARGADLQKRSLPLCR
jgi:DHA2 family multidrug resistance protein